MNEIFEKIHQIGILPVIALDDAAQAVPLAEALGRGRQRFSVSEVEKLAAGDRRAAFA